MQIRDDFIALEDCEFEKGTIKQYTNEKDVQMIFYRLHIFF